MKAGLSLFLLLAASSAEAAKLVRGPYQEGTTAYSAYLCLRADAPVHGVLEWQEKLPGAKRAEVRSTAPAPQHCLEAQGLAPAATYQYRVGWGEPGGEMDWSRWRTLRTVEPPGSAIRFGVFGDTGKDSEGQALVAARIAKDRPSFLLHLGDVVYPYGADADYDAKYFKHYGPFADEIPIYIAIGNHDYANHWLRAGAGARWVNRNFLVIHRLPRQNVDGGWEANPEGRTYYSFDRGDAHFVAVDANQAYPIPGAPKIDAESRQYRWLEKDLAGSGARWKFVFLHVPLYSSGRHGRDENLIEWLAPLFEKHRVDIVFQGHDHDYERTFPIRRGRKADAGPVYIVAGNAGAALTGRARIREWSAFFASRFGYVDVRIEGGRLELRAVSPDGEVFDRFELNKDEPAAGEPRRL